jgi:membrane protein implicated in regulation of membrane protease activity
MASALTFLFGWANAPFAVAAGVVAAFALLQVSGLLGILAGAEDHDHGAGGDGDGHDHGDDDGPHAPWASALGFGVLPFSMIWETFGLVAAGIGYALNFSYLGRPGGPPLVTLLWTLPAAVAGGAAGVAWLARSVGPVLSSKEHEATRRADLVGQLGVVISTRVSEEFGEVRIRDKTGHDLRVVCKLATGVRVPPREHDRVVVVDCDDRGALLVEPLDEGDAFGRTDDAAG